MEQHELSRLTSAALARAIDGDMDGAATAIVEIGRNSADGFDVYAACCGFAEAARKAMVTLDGGTPTAHGWAMRPVEDDDQVDAPLLFARRFIIAYANNDEATALALWRAALFASHAEYVASVASLLATAARLVNQAARP
ncbi:hypothetical protein QFZ66_005835 [Streptomyces sp. B4I13]|uniref:hypothetical protein n=1 Tax=Streptomyces sp. B4I13 TaxID=3042271 RepID=UPI002782D10A|nr:hypothetical protein [Streptomyces sp. B4I13]MDQ0961957.1 hypothetical protein [Streptomyces sp. B4I13]